MAVTVQVVFDDPGFKKLGREIEVARHAALKAATEEAASALRRQLRRGKFTSRTGRLRSQGAVATRVNRKRRHGLVGYSKAAYYGYFLDAGTRDIRARGFSDRAVEEEERQIIATFFAAFRKELNRVL